MMKIDQLLVCVIALFGQADTVPQDVGGFETRIHGDQMEKTTQQQCRAEEQDYAQGHLRDRQRRAPTTVCDARGLVAARFDEEIQIRPPREQRGCEAQQQRHRGTRGRGEGERGAIQVQARPRPAPGTNFGTSRNTRPAAAQLRRLRSTPQPR